MPRPRIYEDDAARVAAFRERKRIREAEESERAAEAERVRRQQVRQRRDWAVHIIDLAVRAYVNNSEINDADKHYLMTLVLELDQPSRW